MKRLNAIFILALCLAAGTLTSWATKNPLSVVAEYNLKADGTFESGDPLAICGAYFKWTDVKDAKVPAGYHVPTKEELLVISGIYPPTSSDAKTPYPDLSWNIDKTGEETVTLFGRQ